MGILIVDDERELCQVLKILFENDGYSVLTAHDGEHAIQILEGEEYIDLVISDLKLPGIDGMGILDYLLKQGKATPLILITAYGTISDAVEAMKKGAADFITKPFNKNVIRHIVRRVLHVRRLEQENRLLREDAHGDKIVCQSAEMQQVMDLVARVAPVSTPVLILGQSGTGKELIARAIHSYRPERPFIKVNCAAIPETLIESELFGYSRGAFTGANVTFLGKAKLADGGTLFLDEIGDLPLPVQPKLLRVLEDKAFEPLGSNTTVHIETRIICATNRDLRKRVRTGRFREDLLYRINTVTIEIPPLGARPQDILLLAEAFLDRYAKELGKRRKRLSEELKAALLSYNWPGNVRELRNVIERAVVLSSAPVLALSDVPPEIRSSARATAVREENKLERAEKALLLKALQRSNGNISAAARELGVSRDTLRYRMGKFGLRAKSPSAWVISPEN